MSNVAYLPIEADRYGACVRQIYLRGFDATGVAMRAQVRLDGDTPGDPLVDLQMVTNGNAEGLRLVGVTVAEGVPTSHIELVINETTIEALPYAGEIGSPTELRWDCQLTISNRKQRLARGEFIITGDGVTGADSAPANRPAGSPTSSSSTGGMRSGATLTFGADVMQVSIDGADLAAVERIKSEAAAGQSKDAAAQAAAAAASLKAFTGQRAPAGYSFAVLDGSAVGRMAFGISDGAARFRGAVAPAGMVLAAALGARRLLAETLNGYVLDNFLPTIAGITGVAPISAPAVSLALDASKAQRSAAAILSDGTLEAANFRPRKVDGVSAYAFYRDALGRTSPRGGGCFRCEFEFIATTGQSNSEGAKGAYIGVGFGQVWDALGMKPKTNSHITPFPLTNSLVDGSTTVATGIDWPGLGYAMMARKLIVAENGLSVTDQPYRQIIANCGYGGTTIAQRSKGGNPAGGLTASYANVIAALTRAVSEAQAGNMPGQPSAGVVKCLSLLNVDGESDAQAGTTGAAYKATSVQRMGDYATDIKAITNQGETPVELLMQCLTNQAKLQTGNSIRSGTLVGGSGGTDGTFNLVIPAPAQVAGNSGIQAVGTFTVASGAVTAVNITNVGAGYRGDLALTNAAFANSTGLTGASLMLAAETITMPIATAQRELGAESPQHVLVGPYYQHFHVADYQHPDGLGAQKTGALMAAASKAIWIDHAGPQADKSRWKALQPTKAERSGKLVRLRFDDARGRLLFDTMPWFGMEPTYGFSLVDAAGASIAIASVQIVGRKGVLITAAAAIPAGARVRYGFTVMTTRTDYYAGCGGNLRDSQGEHLRHEGNRLDNWCLAFSEPLA